MGEGHDTHEICQQRVCLLTSNEVDRRAGACTRRSGWCRTCPALCLCLIHREETNDDLNISSIVVPIVVVVVIAFAVMTPSSSPPLSALAKSQWNTLVGTSHTRIRFMTDLPWCRLHTSDTPPTSLPTLRQSCPCGWSAHRDVLQTGESSSPRYV